MSKYIPCPCDPKKLYHKCCQPFHDGELPDTALMLMKSRYSAFALNKPDYIIDTTHKNNPESVKNIDEWKQDLQFFSSQAKFNGLKIEEFLDGDTSAYVTFTAFLSQGEKDISFTEKSTFKKESGKWFYLSGDIKKELRVID